MLVEDWKQCWKWLSMWGGLAVVVWGALSPAQQAWIVDVLPGQANVTMALGIFIVVVRVLRQASIVEFPKAAARRLLGAWLSRK